MSSNPDDSRWSGYDLGQAHHPPQPGFAPQSYSPVPSHPSSLIHTGQVAPPAGGYPHPPVWVPPVPVYPYARWIRRVGGYLIDFAPAYVAMITFWIGYVLAYLQLIQVTSGGPSGSLSGPPFRTALVWMAVGLLLMLAAFGWLWYNRWLIAGRTGQSMGKRVVKTKLVAEVNGLPIGPVNAFLRDLLHILDGAAYLGYLWPLWDAKRQTFADMIMKTVVIDHPAPSDPGPPPPAHEALSLNGPTT